MAFFDTSPISMMMPIMAVMPIELPVTSSASNAPTIA